MKKIEFPKELKVTAYSTHRRRRSSRLKERLHFDVWQEPDFLDYLHERATEVAVYKLVEIKKYRVRAKLEEVK